MTQPSDSADRAWTSARKMPHSYIPDQTRDAVYLALLLEAARGGHAQAMSKLGDYAWRRRAIVEAYFWYKMAALHGLKMTHIPLSRCRRLWLLGGAQTEQSNISLCFTSRQGVLGRAALRLDTGRDADRARQRLSDLAAAGDETARLILEDKRDTP